MSDRSRVAVPATSTATVHLWTGPARAVVCGLFSVAVLTLCTGQSCSVSMPPVDETPTPDQPTHDEDVLDSHPDNPNNDNNNDDDDGNNDPPVITPGLSVEAGSAQTVNEGAEFTLAGTVTGGVGTNLSYNWQQTVGPAPMVVQADGLTMRFQAPAVDEDTSLTFQLTVDDGESTAADTVTVTVLNVPTVEERDVQLRIVTTSDVGPVPLTVGFTAATFGEKPLPSGTYTWNFADGSTAAGTTAEHTFAAAGTHVVTLCAMVDLGQGPVERCAERNILAQPNRAPTAVAVSSSTEVGTPLEITLTASDPDNQPVDFAIVSGPLHGTLSPVTPVTAASARVVYTGATGYCGSDTFTFIATDGALESAPATVTLSILPEGMVFIPAGTFQMGDPFVVEGDVNERPTHSVSLDAFFMDRYETTNQEYASALNWALGQGGLIVVTSGVVYQPGTGTSYPYCSTNPTSPTSQITWNGGAFGVVAGKANYPVTEVTWYGAVACANWRSAMHGRTPAYDLASWTCNWGAGYRLPTEAEWERAARGGVAGHRFPWSDSNTVDFTRANYYSSASLHYDDVDVRGYHPLFSTSGYPYTCPVGTFAPNDYGLYEMAGNVFEWCHDWYDANYYGSSPSSNPRGPATGSTRVLRSGSWASTALNLRCAYRTSGMPTHRNITNGFRLVMQAD